MKSKLPGCEHYLISTFFFPQVKKPRTSLHPPILRPEILAAKSEPGEHLLVYQTSTSYAELPEVLKGTGLPCKVYGFRRDLEAPVVEGNLTYMPFSESGFIDDLRTARAVVAGGGFTLMGEAVYLHKPMLAVPVKKQFEQVLNARYLEYEGYGMYAEQLGPEVLEAFLAKVPEYQRRLDDWRQDGNTELFAKLDEVLAQAKDGGAPEES